MESIKIVLGLGNPGAGYRWTRHNIGFRVVDRLAERGAVRFRADPALRRRALQAVIDRGGDALVLAKPRTYMNHSGRAALALCKAHRVPPTGMLVVYDDADLRFGAIRIRNEGGAGGHNGVRSLIETLGTREFPRLRLGVRGAGRGDRELADYVLDRFDADEEPLVEALVDLGVEGVEEVLRHDLATAMNLFNGRRVESAQNENSDPNSE